MSDPRDRSRGTTFVPLAIDVTPPSPLMRGGNRERHARARFIRSMLIAGATVVGLAILLATRIW